WLRMPCQPVVGVVAPNPHKLRVRAHNPRTPVLPPPSAVTSGACEALSSRDLRQSRTSPATSSVPRLAPRSRPCRLIHGHLYGGAVPIAGPHAQGAVYRGHPYLPVADRFRPGMLGDRLDQGFDVVIEGDDIQPGLVQQRHPGRAGPGGELAELSAEPTDFGHGQTASPVVD